MKKRVLLFDCDGVLADTERDGHRVAFNRMWREKDISWRWSVEAYGRALAISGGKERMRVLRDNPYFRRVFDAPESDKAWDAVIRDWHARKTEIYTQMITNGQIPPRSGVKRLAREALAVGWILGVCSTSNLEGVAAVLEHVMGEIAGQFSLLLAGDVVSAKKPDPAIYNLAAERLDASPNQCVVIEDTRHGLVAAHTAGMKCLVTVNDYTKDQDFSEAEMVVSCLGDPDGEKCQVLANRSPAAPGDHITIADLERILET